MITNITNKDLIHKLDPEYDNFVKVLAETQRDLSLICFLGAGTSIFQGYKNWSGYVQDLIQYWKSHLEDVMGPDSLLPEVYSGDLKFLDWLNEKSGFDNKRKVDMVHYLIKKYSKPKSNNKTEWINNYKKHENDFEHYYFLKIAPLKKNNEIIDQLIKMSGFFITTNYDDQLERGFENYFESKPNILNDVNDLTDSKLPNKTILHLHGKPVRPGVLLVSSSRSYNQLYLNNNNFKEKLRKQIQKQGSKVLLFIGSSLQEEEILHLFTFNEPKIKKYALMKYRKDLDQTGANLLKDYYEQEKKINIIWYGKKYADLPIFLSILNEDVNKQLEKNSSFVSANTILQNLRNHDYTSFAENVTRAFRNNEYFIDSCFKDNLDSISIEILMNNRSFLSKVLNGYEFINFWSEVNRNFNSLSHNLVSKLINIIEDMPGISGEYNIVNILYKYSNFLDQKSRVNFLLKRVSKFLFRSDKPCRLCNNLEKILWLLTNFSEKNYFYSFNSILHFEGNKKIIFKLSSNTLKSLLKIINKDKFVQAANFKQLINDERWNTLYFLLKEERLKYNLSSDFPNYFYRNKLIQRLLINLALENALPSNINLEKLIKNINYKDKLLGRETNAFVKRFVPSKEKMKDFYIDGWSTYDLSSVRDKPFYKVTPLESKEAVDDLILNLKKALRLRPTVNNQNLYGEKENLIEVLNNSTTWDNFARYNILFLEKAINDQTIFIKYLSEINEMLIEGVKRHLVSNNLLDIYLWRFFQIPHVGLKPENINFLEFLSKHGSTSHEKLLYDHLFKIDPVQLSFHSKTTTNNDSQKWILLDDFLDSEACEYYSLIETLIKNNTKEFNDKYKRKFINGINSMNEIERDYIKGRFYQYFIKDKDLQSENSFIGFSHKYQINYNIGKFFASQIIKLLNSNFHEEFCEHNIIFILLYILNPHEAQMTTPIEAKNYKKTLIVIMLKNFLCDKLTIPNNAIQWAEWLMKNITDSYQTILNLIIQNIIHFPQGNQLFNLLIDKSRAIKKYSLSLKYVYFKSKIKYSKDCFKLILKIINTLFQRHLLNINYMLPIEIDSILGAMYKNSYPELIKQALKISRQFLLPDDQKHLEKKYLGVH